MEPKTIFATHCTDCDWFAVGYDEDSVEEKKRQHEAPNHHVFEVR